MAKFVNKDVYLAVNGTAISDHCREVNMTDEAEEVDFTSMGPSGYREFGTGFKDVTIDATLYSDFAASSIHAMLQPLYSTGGTFSLEIRPTSAAVSATNPKGTMTARILNYSPIAGGIGDAATFETQFRNAGTAGLVWATA